MALDFATLDLLRAQHPAWRLLSSPHAPLIASFLHRVFIVPNVRVMAALDLSEALEDELFALRQHQGANSFPGSALDYLNEWANPQKGWLRRFYRYGSDELQFDITPATEKAIAWLASLLERSFVGTESRLLMQFDLLKQMSAGSEIDPARRLAELHKKRAEIDAEIAQVEAGKMVLLNDTELKDRFQQFTQLARDLLGDFREVEHNFRQLDRRVRERIALWDGAKGTLLEQIMGERDAIADSDQGKSFRAFWDFLMSSSRQEELTRLLEQVLALPAVNELKPDPRTRRVHYDWLEAGEHTQRTVAQLSQQLRRFLDDQAWLENRRIMEILHGIEARALALRGLGMNMKDTCMQLDAASADIELALERPLHTPAAKALIADLELEGGEPEIDPAALYGQVVVDSEALLRHIRQCLQERTQITLKDLVASRPLAHGLAELVVYLQVGSEQFKAVVEEENIETITWQAQDAAGIDVLRQARMPRVIFVR
jgi:Protein of unknown function (DUF3375)